MFRENAAKAPCEAGEEETKEGAGGYLGGEDAGRGRPQPLEGAQQRNRQPFQRHLNVREGGALGAGIVVCGRDPPAPHVRATPWAGRAPRPLAAPVDLAAGA